MSTEPLADAYRDIVRRSYVRLLLGQTGSEAPAWLDPDGFPFLAPVRAAAPRIVQEGRAVLSRFEALAARYPHHFAPAHPGLVGRRASFYLRLAGLSETKNQALCPETTAAVEAVPHITNAAFYLLGPRSRILPHRGICDDLLRAHVGAVCPSDAALRVNGEARPWREGEMLVFDDRHEHEARNDSDQWRCVLLFDFIPTAHIDPGQQAAIMAQQRLQIVKRVDFEGHHLAGLTGDEQLAPHLAAAAERLRAERPGDYEALARAVEENGFYTV